MAKFKIEDVKLISERNMVQITYDVYYNERTEIDSEGEEIIKEDSQRFFKEFPKSLNTLEIKEKINQFAEEFIKEKQIEQNLKELEGFENDMEV